jgi:peptidoglycan/xylan/chitin deacetylase (PgdA/CDA1 family)
MPDRSDLNPLARLRDGMSPDLRRPAQRGWGGGSNGPAAEARDRLRRAAKAAAAGAILATGAHRLVRAVRTRQAGGARVLLLSYHRAVLDWAEGAREAIPSMLVSAATLRRHLEHLARSWEIVSLSDAARILAEGPRGPARAFAAITFDDGYADNHAVALPVLSALKIPATVYVATGFTGTDARFVHDRLFATLRELGRRGIRPEAAGLEAPVQAFLTAAAGASATETLDRLIAWAPHGAVLAVAAALEERTGRTAADLPGGARPLDWDEVKDLAGAGLDVGGHSVRHAALPNLPLSEARREIEGCRDAIAERLGRPPRHFAYPNGFHSPAIRRSVRDAGYETGSTTEDRENVRGCDPYALRRKVLWEGSTLGPLGYSDALATCSFDGVFRALKGRIADAGERPDPPAAAAGLADDPGHRAAS